PYGPRDVVAPVHPQAEGPLGRRPGPRPLTGAARVIEGSSDAEEGRVEEVLEGAGHVAEVRRGAEEVAVRGEDVVGGGLEGRDDLHLHPLDVGVLRSLEDGVEPGPAGP